jgi:MFS family permease
VTTTEDRRHVYVSTVAEREPFSVGRWSVIGLSSAVMTRVITASTIGKYLGAATVGSLSDRIGRRSTMILAPNIFGTDETR